MNPLLATLAIVTVLAGGPSRRPAAEPGPPVPVLDPTGCTAVIDNPYFPLRPGTVRVYATGAGKAAEVDTVVVLREPRLVLGVQAVGVRGRTYRDGRRVAESLDWYVQDRRGNVWVLAGETRTVADSAGTDSVTAWEAGVDSACAGIVMPAIPEADMRYRGAYRRGRIEELAEVRHLEVRTTVMGETFTACLETEHWSALDRRGRERRVHAPGIGLVVRSTPGGSDRTRLVGLIGP